jgi:hypothetical protein
MCVEGPRSGRGLDTGAFTSAIVSEAGYQFCLATLIQICVWSSMFAVFSAFTTSSSCMRSNVYELDPCQ